MWRKALVGLVLLLPGCAYFGDFLGDSLTYDTNPNLPAGNAENMRRVRGQDSPTDALRTEPGNVWPTGVQTAPTLQELERDTNSQAAPPPLPNLLPSTPGRRGAPPAMPSASAPSPASPTIATPQGPAAPATGGPGYQQIAPSPGQPGGIVIPNGNGTSTLIRPDGTVVTVPTPK
jgi:hypothetical protein